MQKVIQFSLNGETTRLETEPDRPLLWVLRGDLALTGTKYGCGEGLCGACTVLVNGSAERSCILTVGDVAGKRVTTIEGLAAGGELHPVQKAFMEHDALQCGYCTPGMVLASVALLSQKPDASGVDIAAGLAGFRDSISCKNRRFWKHNPDGHDPHHSPHGCRR